MDSVESEDLNLPAAPWDELVARFGCHQSIRNDEFYLCSNFHTFLMPQDASLNFCH